MIIILIVLFLSFPAYASATGSNSSGYATESNSTDKGNIGGGGGWDGGNQRGNEKPDSDDTDAQKETTNPFTDTHKSDGNIAAQIIPSELITAETDSVATPSSTFQSKQNPAAHASIILSKQQVKQQMLANPQSLTFIENNMKLIIPAELLINHLPKDFKTFKVSMAFDGDDEFYIYFTVNETVISDWSDINYTIYIPWQGETQSIYCYQTIDQKIAASNYEQGHLVFDLSQTGHYWIDSDEAILDSSLLPPKTEYNYQSTPARYTPFPKHYLVLAMFIPFICMAPKIARKKRSEN